uniref:(northern house mosquito) hypothetical protein n=1 Tax=Culex pipiens TaxID=7175 RepID=A0A8D8A5T0_CULPI
MVLLQTLPIMLLHRRRWHRTLRPRRVWNARRRQHDQFQLQPRLPLLHSDQILVHSSQSFSRCLRLCNSPLAEFRYQRFMATTSNPKYFIKKNLARDVSSF